MWMALAFIAFVPGPFLAKPRCTEQRKFQYRRDCHNVGLASSEPSSSKIIIWADDVATKLPVPSRSLAGLKFFAGSWRSTGAFSI